MSDGNFNRQLLPKTELSSGLRAGKAQMRQRAELAFDKIAESYFTKEQMSNYSCIKEDFLKLLRE